MTFLHEEPKKTGIKNHKVSESHIFF